MHGINASTIHASSLQIRMEIVLTTECKVSLVADMLRKQWFVLVSGDNCMWFKQPICFCSDTSMKCIWVPLRSLAIQYFEHDDETDICDGE